MNAAQCRAARHLLGWSSGDLARTVGIPAADVRHFEDGAGGVEGSALINIHQAFEAAGVEFRGESCAGSAVRMRRRH